MLLFLLNYWKPLFKVIILLQTSFQTCRSTPSLLAEERPRQTSLRTYAWMNQSWVRSINIFQCSICFNFLLLILPLINLKTYLKLWDSISFFNGKEFRAIYCNWDAEIGMLGHAEITWYDSENGKYKTWVINI